MANALTKVTGNVIDSTTNITAGIITATSFVGSGANLTGVASTDNIRTNTNATFLQNINVTGIVTASGVNVSGVVTATSFSGSGANLTGVASTDNIRTNTNATFLQNINVTGIVTASGANISGVSTFTTVKVGTAATIDSSGVQVGAGKSIRLYGATSGFSDIIAAAGSASTIFTLPANGGSNGQVLSTDGSGALSWINRDPAVGPAFLVTRDTAWSASNGTATKVAFNYEVFDQGGCFDHTTNFRFTPNVAGYYQLSATVTMTGASWSGGYDTIYIYRNGSNWLRGNIHHPSNGNYTATHVSALVEANGSSDYYEIYHEHGNCGTNPLSGITGGFTFFSGSLVQRT